MLYDFVQKYDIEKNVVSFATDSIITTKKIEIDSEKLGDFKFENSGDDVYVLQNGIYRFNGKWKKRGRKIKNQANRTQGYNRKGGSNNEKI